MTTIDKVASECIYCCHRVHRCVTTPTLGENCAVECESVVTVATSACSPYDKIFQDHYSNIKVTGLPGDWTLKPP